MFKKILTFSLLMISLFFYTPIFAQDLIDYVNPVGKDLKVPAGGNVQTTVQDAVGKVANSFIGKILGVIGLLVLCMFVFSGLIYISARGEAAQVKKANETMKWSAIGLVLVFSSYMIINFLFSTINSFNGK